MVEEELTPRGSLTSMCVLWNIIHRQTDRQTDNGEKRPDMVVYLCILDAAETENGRTLGLADQTRGFRPRTDHVFTVC